MEAVLFNVVILLVLCAVWVLDWLRRAIDDYQNDENHK